MRKMLPFLVAALSVNAGAVELTRSPLRNAFGASAFGPVPPVPLEKPKSYRDVLINWRRMQILQPESPYSQAQKDFDYDHMQEEIVREWFRVYPRDASTFKEDIELFYSLFGRASRHEDFGVYSSALYRLRMNANSRFGLNAKWSRVFAPRLAEAEFELMDQFGMTMDEMQLAVLIALDPSGASYLEVKADSRFAGNSKIFSASFQKAYIEKISSISATLADHVRKARRSCEEQLDFNF